MLNDIETTKQETIREVSDIPNIQIKGKVISPFIIIDRYENKIRILINKDKKYRVLHEKNVIQQGLDIFLVDLIREVLKTLAEKEGEIEHNIMLAKSEANENERSSSS